MLNTNVIKKRREAKGLTLAEAARQAGLTVAQAWHRIESGGIQSPRLDTLEAIARVLGCSIADLVTDEKP